jgi:dipeptidase E
MQLLLIGATGSPLYEHCKQQIVHFLRASKRVGLISAANLFDEEAYFRGFEERLTKVEPRIAGDLFHIRWNSEWRETFDTVDAIIIPGGNTYALLMRLYQSGLLDALRKKIVNGLPYIGSSAGANVAGANILTTNDWNVVGWSKFDALGVVSFNINPHYVERGSSDAPNSETRDYRILEYHQVRQNPVVGLEERAILEIVDSKVSVLGEGRAKVFTAGNKQRWAEIGDDLTFDVGN